MKRLAFGLVFVGLVHVAGSVVEDQSRCTFPSENQHCVSPGDRWEVEWQAPSPDATFPYTSSVSLSLSNGTAAGGGRGWATRASALKAEDTMRASAPARMVLAAR